MLDLSAYSGKWYELGKMFVQPFEADCVTATAEYELRTDLSYRIVNHCYGYVSGLGPWENVHSRTFPGVQETRSIVGIGYPHSDWIESIDRSNRPIGRAASGVLEVNFNGDSGFYQVLDTNYDDYSIVGGYRAGDTRFQNIWVLYRRPTLSENSKSEIRFRLRELNISPWSIRWNFNFEHIPAREIREILRRR